MNLQAFFDGLLALAALWVAWVPARHFPALRLGSLILATAAVLGTLRFSGVLPLPPWHQFFSMLGAGVGLPLLAVTVCMPEGSVARTRRFAWIFAVIAAVVCILIVMLAQFKLWPSLCAAVAALSIMACALARRDWHAAAVGVFTVLAFGAFVGKVQLAGLEPGDFLHIGLAIALLLLGEWARRRPIRTQSVAMAT